MPSVSSVLKTRDRLVASFAAAYFSTDGGGLRLFADHVATMLPPEIPYTAIFQTLCGLSGQTLDKTVLYRLAWRLAGNLDTLRRGHPVCIWQGQLVPEWHPVQVIEAQQTYQFAQKKRIAATEYRIRLMAGSACPAIITKTWSNRFISYFARSELGFSAPWGKSPYVDATELVSLRFDVEIDAEYCRYGKPGFDKVSVRSEHLTWNRKIFKARAHLVPPCPSNYQHPCHQCPIGVDQCMAGTHPTTYVWKLCSSCHKDSWHDPKILNHCLVCRQSKKLV